MRFLLEADDAFLDELRRALTPMSFWIARTFLHYGEARPSYVADLRAAVEAPNFNRVKDLLRAFPQLRTDMPGTREMLERELAGGPAGRDEVLAVFDEQVTATSEREEPLKSVRYGVKDRGDEDPTKLQTQESTARYSIDRTASELRVIVRIHLFNRRSGETYHLPGEKPEVWIYGIEKRWNGKFVANNGRRFSRSSLYRCSRMPTQTSISAWSTTSRRGSYRTPTRGGWKLEARSLRTSSGTSWGFRTSTACPAAPRRCRLPRASVRRRPPPARSKESRARPSRSNRTDTKSRD
jgi:hypothetical protein